METIEIPRFLLDYFDSATIHTPLASIQGYADAMLQGAVGPLTENQHRFLEIIKNNAEQLDQHFSLVLHNQHYIVWDEQAIPVQYTVGRFIEEFKETIKTFLVNEITTQPSDESLPVWFDQRHIFHAFASIGDFISNTYDQNKEISIKSFHKSEAVTFLIEFSKRYEIKIKDLAYYESLLYVAKRVMELHGGLFSIAHAADEKLGLGLVFPNIKPPDPDL